MKTRTVKVKKEKSKLAQWFSQPVPSPGAASKKTLTPKPYGPSTSSSYQPKGSRGRGDQEKAPHRIDEFYPRGSAGHREGRGPRGVAKAVMPRRGNRTKNPRG